MDELRKRFIALSNGFYELFENQRRGIGASYGVSNEIRVLAKRGIAALKNKDIAELDLCLKGIQECWHTLSKLSVPSDLAWTFDGEAGQEMVELFMVVPLYRVLFEGENAESVMIPSHEDLEVTPQNWLAGVGDAITELGKLHLEKLCQDDLSKSDRLAFRKRFIGIAQTIRDVMGDFETAYPMVINNSRRRGFGNTYRGLLLRIDLMIGKEQEAIAAMLDQDAK